MNRLENKAAAITGAASGIGRASAKLFAAEGAAVLVTDLRGDGAETVAEEIRADGGHALSMKVDVGDDKDVRAMIDRTVAEFGHIDVLYNNAVNNDPAMSARDVDFLQFDPEVFNTNMRINLLGGLLACKYALPHMLAQGSGSIIFTSSTSSLAGEISAFTYGATKAAMNWYVQTIAATYGKQGVRCNAVVPGVIVTPSMKAWTNAEMETAFLEMQNVPRLGQPEDIANMALFLASEESQYCNGCLYPVNGGAACGTPMVPVVRKFLNPA